MNNILKKSVQAIAGTFLIGGFIYLVGKSHYEPTYPDAVIQYKSSTVSPVYSGFDDNRDGEIDSINVFRARWLGYQNYTLGKEDTGFKEIKERLDSQLSLESVVNIYTGEKRTINK